MTDKYDEMSASDLQIEFESRFIIFSVNIHGEESARSYLRRDDQQIAAGDAYSKALILHRNVETAKIIRFNLGMMLFAMSQDDTDHRWFYEFLPNIDLSGSQKDHLSEIRRSCYHAHGLHDWYIGYDENCAMFIILKMMFNETVARRAISNEHHEHYEKVT